MDLGLIIGEMLGVVHKYIEGVIEVRYPDVDPYELKFWHCGTSWRWDRLGGGKTLTDDSTSVVWEGKWTTGPAMDLGGLEVPSLVVPRYAYIWGRPGEDWRLSEPVMHLKEAELVEIRVLSVEGPDRGRLVFDRSANVIKTLELPVIACDLKQVSFAPSEPVEATFRSLWSTRNTSPGTHGH